MYNSKMWLVVKPTIGVPLFFGGVALTSLAIHTAVLTNTTWMPAFFNGRGRAPVAAAAAPAPTGAAPVAAVSSDGSAAAALASAQAALVSAQTALVGVQKSVGSQ